MHRFHPVKRYSTSYQHRKAVTIAATVVATLAIFTGAAFAGDVWFTAQGHAELERYRGVRLDLSCGCRRRVANRRPDARRNW